MNAAYKDFLATKTARHIATGHAIADGDIHPMLFPFQRDLVRWSMHKGRAAIFADTGMGKTLMQLEWARLTGQPTLIVAPLAVARQTIREGRKIGLEVDYARQQPLMPQGLTITNDEMVDHFDPETFGAVVLDESSILKSFDGKTRTKLIDLFAGVPYRLCCTATPAPNDIGELANHAEFLGICTRVEMLAQYFVHDDEGWRLKGHAEQAFYKWLASWGMSLKRPSDLGYSDEGYDLPGLDIESLIVASDYAPEGQLFPTVLKGIGDRAAVRRATLSDRVRAAAALINETREPYIAWCGLNDESHELAALVSDAVEVEGSQSPEEKAALMEAFINGEARVLVTKPSIAGFGMNFQHCARMVFVGLSDSYEQYYQCIRRCYRYGQTRPVKVHIVLTEVEQSVLANVRRKEEEAERTGRELVKHVAEFERAEIGAKEERFVYQTRDESGDGWKLMLGDSVERLGELAEASVDLSVFSPPFQSLFVYSPTERDLGNSRTPQDFWGHFNFIIDELLRVTKPGRNVAVHVSQLPTTLTTHGVIGLADFRGATISGFEARGFVYHGEVCIDKDPQAQAIRTHSKGLLFVQLRKDASWLRPALADYILVFRKPGDNAVPIHPDLTNDEWIEWARPIWYGIRESDTLNVVEARSDKDERHICPLQLGTIERVIRLWSNPGETVLTPFAGIGSEVYQAVKLGRRGIGIELKPEYFTVAVRNMRRLEADRDKQTLFSEVVAS
jgi:DNA modification methylase/superfamily II DNA or RNA helicase